MSHRDKNKKRAVFRERDIEQKRKTKLKPLPKVKYREQLFEEEE